MEGFKFDAHCLCGGTFVYVNGARQSSCEACAIVKCVRCSHEYGVHVSLQPIRQEVGWKDARWESERAKRIDRYGLVAS